MLCGRGGGKRGASGKPKAVDKDETIQAMMDALQVDELKLSRPIANVFADTVNHTKLMINESIGHAKPISNLLAHLSSEDLQKVFDTTSTGNLEWKTKELAKIGFPINYRNAVSVTTNIETCKSMMHTAVMVLFTKQYLGDDGTYAHKQYTADVVHAMQELAKQAGRNDERRANGLMGWPWSSVESVIWLTTPSLLPYGC